MPTNPITEEDAALTGMDPTELAIFREAIKRGVDQDTADQIAQAAAARLEASTRQVPTPEMIEAVPRNLIMAIFAEMDRLDDLSPNAWDRAEAYTRAVLTAMSQKAAPAVPSEAAELDTLLDRAETGLRVATVASCNCDHPANISPEPEAHELTCRYRVLYVAATNLADARAALTTPRQKAALAAASEEAATRIAELERRIRKAKRELKQERFEARDRIAYALAALAASSQKAAE